MKQTRYVKSMGIIILLFSAMFSAQILSSPMDEEGLGMKGQRAEQMKMRLGMLERYLNVVESVHSIADDPEKSVIFQLQQLEDIYKKQRNFDKILDLYKSVLNKTSNQAVRNAVSMKLGQLLRRTGRGNEAEQLMRNALEENMKKLK